MLDSRAEVFRILGRLEFSSWRALVKSTLCILFAALVALVPEYEGLTPAGHWALFILLIAAGMWIIEAIPAFAVAILVIGLEILILGKPGGVFAPEGDTKFWQMFIEPWSSPLIWLFFGGFVLAEGATKTGMDRWMAGRLIPWFGTRPGPVLFGVMAITFVFSMFMSNTATTAMMIAIISPVVATIRGKDPLAKSLFLAVPFAANIGGMGTIIGTPPNAIAAGALQDHNPISFVTWMIIGLPPALLLLGALWLFLRLVYPPEAKEIDFSVLEKDVEGMSAAPMWKRLMVAGVFTLTVGLWLTETFHGMPVYVVAFFPITIFSVAGILGTRDIRNLPWDVLLLITGGLALGVAVKETGLAEWMVQLVPTEALGVVALAFAFAYISVVMSNFMSHTAATTIIVPIGFSLAAAGAETQLVVPIALASSVAMALPISTPPNAIAFATGRIQTRDFLQAGILTAIFGPTLVVLWCWLIINVLGVAR